MIKVLASCSNLLLTIRRERGENVFYNPLLPQ